MDNHFFYEDLRFVFEKFIPWDRLAEARGTENLKDEYLMAMDAISDFCKKSVWDRAAAIDEKGCELIKDENGRNAVKLPSEMEENIETLKEMGFFCGASLEFEYGGADFPCTVMNGIGELFYMADGSIGLTPGLQDGCAVVVQEYANDKIRGDYLPRLVSGERYCAMGLTEAGAGSDLAVMKTTARPLREGEESDRINELKKLGEVYIVNGQKLFITNGFQDVLTLARTPEGISMFLTFGEDIDIVRIEHKLGIKGSPTCQLSYEDTPGILIGELGKGLIHNMLKLMHLARLGVASQALGLAQKAHNMAKEYATDVREQFGVKIVEHPPVRQVLFENEIELQASRALTYIACYYFDLMDACKRRLRALSPGTPEFEGTKKELNRNGRIAEILISLTKYDASELAIQSVYQSGQVFAGVGFTKELPIERIYRDVRITTIYEGTSHIQVNMVFNETFYLEKIWLLNQFRAGGSAGLVETPQNKTFFDTFVEELIGDVQRRGEGDAAIAELIEGATAIRADFKAARESIFMEGQKRQPAQVKSYNGVHQEDYVNLVGLVLKSILLIQQALISPYKRSVAKAYIERACVRSGYLKSKVLSAQEDLVTDAYHQVVTNITELATT